MSVNKCECQNWFFGTYGEDGSAESFEDYGTNCTQTTGRTFAQGHDAKLVGFLVRADLAGEEIAKVDGGMRVTFQNATHAAGTISEALAAKADAMMAAAIARLQKKSNTSKSAVKIAEMLAEGVREDEREEAAELVEQVRQATTPRATRGKVGRWVYDGTEQDGRFTYSKKFGGEATVEAGNWTEQA